jgi:hypothetical protein
MIGGDGHTRSAQLSLMGRMANIQLTFACHENLPTPLLSILVSLDAMG